MCFEMENLECLVQVSNKIDWFFFSSNKECCSKYNTKGIRLFKMLSFWMMIRWGGNKTGAKIRL